MKKKPVNISASVLAKLKNIADKDDFDFNFLLLRYIQERFLSRLAVSGHVNKFILKGGFLLLAYNIEKARPTKDIDFLGINVSRDRKELERLVREIAIVDLSDGVRFLTESVRSAVIKENADYEGIRIRLTATIGSAKNTIQIDCGFGDIISPHPLQMDYPTLLHKGRIKVLAYSKETIVAEKFEAIVKLRTFNTRMKDFFDIAFLANELDFDGKTLQIAIRNTFARRQTGLNLAKELLDSDFGNRAHFQRHWHAFKRRTRLSTSEVFSDIFKVIQVFITPTIEAEMAGKSLSLNWDRRVKKWS